MHTKTRRHKALLAGVILVAAAAMEANAAPTFWTDWTAGTYAGSGSVTSDGFVGGSGAFTGLGTITTSTATVDVTYTNAQGISAFQRAGGIDYYANGFFGVSRNPATSPYTSTAVDNIPTGTDIVALQFAGNQTLTFSQAIANPVFAFVSLNFNGYAFLNQDFEILSVSGQDGNDCGYWGCGNVAKVLVDLGGGNFEYQLNQIPSNTGSEPHGVIRFLGAFDTLTWRSQSFENWNGFTVGVQGTAQEVFLPEPGTIALLSLGLAGIFGLRRRRAA